MAESVDRYVTVPLRESADKLHPAMALMELDIKMVERGIKTDTDMDIQRQALGEVELGVLSEPEPYPWNVRRLRSLMESAYHEFSTHVACVPGGPEGWTLVEGERRTGWNLLQCAAPSGTHMVRFEGQLNAPAHRIAHVIRDIDLETRCLWDCDDLRPMKLAAPGGQVLVLPAIRRRGPRIINPHKKRARQERMEKRGRAPLDRCYEVVEAFIHPPVIGGITIPGIATRRMLSVQWGRYDAAKGEFVLLSRTLEDVEKDEARFGCPAECVDVTGMTGVRLVRAGQNKTRVTMVVAMNPNGSLPSDVITWGLGKIIQRIELIEAVCQDDRFRAVYEPKEKK